MDAAYKQFYKGGFTRTGVDVIAEAAGITKRTLYQHFESKSALIAAVLAVQDELSLARIREWSDRGGGDAEDLVDNLFTGMAAWAGRKRWRSSGFTRAALEFADSPGHPGRLAARRHKAAVEAWLAREFVARGIADASRLAQAVMLLIEGCHSLVLIHGNPHYIDTASRTARLLVKQLRQVPASGPGGNG